MGLKRKPFQGVYNILRFNWHFFAIAFAVATFLFLIKDSFGEILSILIGISAFLIGLSVLVSLLVSFYVYDISKLYQFSFLPNFNGETVLNITAGFDETSTILKDKFPKIDLTIVDFYDEKKHTEVSIKRARKAYPRVENTHSVSTKKLPFPNDFFDHAVAVFSAHEIRKDEERIQFFKEMSRVTKTNGEIFVTEHLRDIYNFAAYNIGFFHFHSLQTWSKTFSNARLIIKRTIKTTAFVTTFIITKNGNTP